MRSADRRGMTLVELLVALTIFGVVISVAPSFIAQKNTAFQMSLECMSALRNARYAVTTLAQDLETVGTDVPGNQPSFVYGDDDVVVFSADDATEVAGVASPAEMLTFFFAPDSITDRDDDFLLHRQVNGGAPEVVARHLLRDGTIPFFEFEREIGGTSALATVPGSALPIHHSEGLHLAPAETGASALADGIRMVRVTLVATNGLTGEHERSVRIERSIALPNSGQSVLSTCGSAPIFGE